MTYFVKQILNNQDKVKNLIKLGQKEVKKLTWEKAGQKTLNVYQEFV